MISDDEESEDLADEDIDIEEEIDEDDPVKARHDELSGFRLLELRYLVRAAPILQQENRVCSGPAPQGGDVGARRIVSPGLQRRRLHRSGHLAAGHVRFDAGSFKDTGREAEAPAKKVRIRRRQTGRIRFWRRRQRFRHEFAFIICYFRFR